MVCVLEWTVLSRTQERLGKRGVRRSAVNQVAVMPSFRLTRQRSSLPHRSLLRDPTVPSSRLTRPRLLPARLTRPRLLPACEFLSSIAHIFIPPSVLPACSFRSPHIKVPTGSASPFHPTTCKCVLQLLPVCAERQAPRTSTLLGKVILTLH
jgi:hypothetical protein